MPNWCDQDLFVRGPKKVRDEFVKAVMLENDDGDSGYGILHTQFPRPAELDGICNGGCQIDGVYVNQWREIDGKAVAIPQEDLERFKKEYGATNWYDWSNKYWGTKWGDCDTELVRHDTRTTRFSLSSAWAPIREGLEEVSKKWPKLQFRLKYYEQGAGYCGVDIIQDGDIENEIYSDNYRGGRGG